ncbi:DUF1932 domain-containing protein [Nocardia sp. NPDC101769]|uniref:DUF1932 domain-containing protein n=1 Tax=Nocardia sp. NPDC101769 TaxID=3364333 RepID=UPI0037F3B666
MIVGLLHPGQMGAAIGARLTAAGHDVLWCPTGRSPATHERAGAAGLRPVRDLTALLGQAELVLAICPAGVAESVAHAVAESGYSGVYVDANAISPQRMNAISDLLTTAATAVVDAMVSGPPPTAETAPRIYMAGPSPIIDPVFELLSGSGFDTTVVAEQIGAASALKMATASFLRTSRALVAIAHALADAHGVTSGLLREADLMGLPMLADRDDLPGVAARAWRWIPEMSEIAATLTDADLPPDLASATAAIYQLLAPMKDDWTATPGQVLRQLKSDARTRSTSGDSWLSGPETDEGAASP